MGLIAALVTDSEKRARLREAAQARAEIRFYERHTDLVTSLRDGCPDALIIELGREDDDVPTASLIRQLRRRIPGVPLTGYCRLTAQTSQEVLEAAKAGVNSLIFHGIDDIPLALQAALTTAQDDCIARVVLHELGMRVSQRTRPVVAYCVQHARRRLTTTRLAQAFHTHRNTLGKRLASDGLPGPGALIGWGRILVASRLMEDVERSVEAIAFELDLSSGSALRNMLKLYTGFRPGDVRERGGLAYMIQVFANKLRGLQRRSSGAMGIALVVLGLSGWRGPGRAARHLTARQTTRHVAAVGAPGGIGRRARCA